MKNNRMGFKKRKPEPDKNHVADSYKKKNTKSYSSFIKKLADKVMFVIVFIILFEGAVNAGIVAGNLFSDRVFSLKNRFDKEFINRITSNFIPGMYLYKAGTTSTTNDSTGSIGKGTGTSEKSGGTTIADNNSDSVKISENSPNGENNVGNTSGGVKKSIKSPGNVNSTNINTIVRNNLNDIVNLIFGFVPDMPDSIIKIQIPLFGSALKNSLKINSYQASIFAPEEMENENNLKEQGFTAYNAGSENLKNIPSIANDKNSANALNESNNYSESTSSDKTDASKGSNNVASRIDNESSSIRYNNANRDTVRKEVLPQDASSIAYDEEDEEKEPGKGDLLSAKDITVQNLSGYKLDIRKLLSEKLILKNVVKGPQVFIYHTHTTESYGVTVDKSGNTVRPNWSFNAENGVLGAGSKLTGVLTKNFGINTIHNTTMHVTPEYNKAYSKSMVTLKNAISRYKSIRIFIDLHRDGTSSKPGLRLLTDINGRKAARIMFVVGTDYGGQRPNPYWKQNLRLALNLQQKLNKYYPGLTRPVYISKKRYNQQLAPNSLLIEIGGDGNFPSECALSVQCLGRVLAEVLK